MADANTDRGTGKTVTRADFSEVVYHRVGLSRTESAELVQSVLDEICDAAVRGETVKLSASAHSSCDRKASGSAATRKPASKCRSCRAASWSSNPPTC